MNARNRRSTRRIIRLPGTQAEGAVDGEDTENVAPGSARDEQSIAFKTPAKAMHKVILQDTKGTMVYGIELQRLPYLSMTTPLGTKVSSDESKFGSSNANRISLY